MNPMLKRAARVSQALSTNLLKVVWVDQESTAEPPPNTIHVRWMSAAEAAAVAKAEGRAEIIT
jgi:hypothetical protein